LSETGISALKIYSPGEKTGMKLFLFSKSIKIKLSNLSVNKVKDKPVRKALYIIRNGYLCLENILTR
jgi:hypothetical protein